MTHHCCVCLFFSVEAGLPGAVFCSRTQRSAPRRQTYVEQDQDQDPWVLLAQTSLEARPEICCPPSDAMNPQENSLVIDSSVNSCDASVPKKGPPVAPKPAWFLQSLRRIQDEQNQRRQRKSEEQLSGIRSRMSIKQKISSFENFSSSSGREQHLHPPSVDDSSSADLQDVDSSHRGFSFRSDVTLLSLSFSETKK
uniref:Uncharacterized protein n=1 Tax=Gouania willdenowi TaxID=441366 RepID=A0A8C5GZC1_GOUWI